jgi:hypothetical protein
MCSLFAYLENAFFRRGQDRYGRPLPTVTAQDFMPRAKPKFENEEQRIDDIWTRFQSAFPKDLQPTP